MTDLDRQIAEVKGWRLPAQKDLEEMSEWQLKMKSRMLDFDMIRDKVDGGFDVCRVPPFSTSDAKALELVDELLNGPGTRTPSFELTFHQGAIQKWSAYFRLGYWDPPQPIGSGDTRPEAICRAYLAAREWMKGRPMDDGGIFRAWLL